MAESEAVRTVREVFERWTGGDVESARDWAPDCEIDLSRALGPYRGVYRADEARRVHDAFLEHWGERRQVLGEFIESGEHVLVPFTDHFRGRDGVEVEASGVWDWTLRDGLVTRLCLYQELDEALAAVGLPVEGRTSSS